MTRLRAWIRSFFGFSRTETNAFLILLPLLFVVIFSEPAYRYWFVQQPHDFTNEKKELDSLITTWKWEQDSATDKTVEKRLFTFDPNITSKYELVALGFDNTLANRIVNYRIKGGKFVVKKDLMKIYGMDSTLYKRVFSFIALPEKIEKENPVKKLERKEIVSTVKFDLNEADTSQLIKVYGIGSKLSQRIVTYRNKLGGFISPEQLKEVYGLDSMVIQELFKKSFISEDFKPRVININTATEKELGDHPYIKYKLAKAITAYRFQHGLYRTLDDLKKIALIDDAKFQKIKPYLSTNP
jgi:DNA uptake protein ComE-like DNA-binding protein